MTTFCKHGNEPSGSTKYGDFGDHSMNCWIVKGSARWRYLVTKRDLYRSMRTTPDLGFLIRV